MKAEALLDALGGTLGDIKAYNFFFFSVIVGDVDTKAFIKTMHQTQAEVEIATPGDTLRDESFTNTLSDFKVETLVNILTDGNKGDGSHAGR